jgi:CRISPR-associated protein Csx16
MSRHEPRKYFVTRHRGAITWAAEGGLKSRKVEMEHFDVSVVGPGDVVMGTLPVHLVAQVCARGGEYWHLAMEIPPDHRGRELSADDMRAFGARLEAFHVQSLGLRLSPTPEVSQETPAAKPSLHVCIVSGEVMANLLPLRHLHWNDVALIVSDEMVANAAHLELLIRRELGSRPANAGARIVHKPLKHTVPLSAVRADMERIAAELRRDFPEHEIVVNWTGGQKLMAQAVLESFRPMARLFYCHTDTDTLEAIWPPAETTSPLPQALTDVETYLFAHGYRIKGQQALDEAAVDALQGRRRLTATLLLAGHKFRYQRPGEPRPMAFLTRSLHYAASQAAPERARHGKPARPFTPRQTVDDVQALPEAGRLLLDELCAQGVLNTWQFSSGRLDLDFPSEAMAAYLAGGYAEEFIALSMLATGLPREHLGVNVRIDVLNPMESRKGSELNELDAVVVWRNRILIIECKAGLQLFQEGSSQQILYKLAALRGIVGRYGNAWMVSKDLLEPDRHADVIDRMKSYSIRGISGASDLSGLPSTLCSWAGLPAPAERLDWHAEVLPLMASRPEAARRPAAPRETPPPHQAPMQRQAPPPRPAPPARKGGKNAGHARPRPRPPERPPRGMPREDE